MNTKGKYHISDDGVARKCSATTKPCQYAVDGTSDNHYDTREQAQAAYEKRRQHEQAAKGKKKLSRAKVVKYTGDNIEEVKKALPSIGYKIHAAKSGMWIDSGVGNTEFLPNGGILVKKRAGKMDIYNDEEYFKDDYGLTFEEHKGEVGGKQPIINSVETAKTAYDEQGHNVFENVDLARDYYKTVYGAAGEHQYRDQYRQLRSNILDSFSEDTYVINLDQLPELSGNWETGKNGGVAFRPLIGIPRDADETSLKKTAEQLEPRLKANAEILGGRAGLSIIEDHLSKAGSFGILAERDTESTTGMGYTLYYTGRPMREKHENLVDTLKDVSNLASYNEDGEDNEYDNDEN